MPHMPCPNCSQNRYRIEAGRANRHGAQLTWFKPGIWWSRLAGTLIAGIMFFIPIAYGVRNVFAGRPIPSAFLLFLLVVILTAAFLVWLHELRQGTPAKKYSCATCQLQWVLRP